MPLGISQDKAPPGAVILGLTAGLGWAKLGLSSAVGSGAGEQDKEGVQPRDCSGSGEGGEAVPGPCYLGIQGRKGEGG